MLTDENGGGSRFNAFEEQLLDVLERIASAVETMSEKEERADFEYRVKSEASDHFSQMIQQMVQRLKEQLDLPPGMGFADIIHYINTTVKPLMERGKEWDRQQTKRGILGHSSTKKRLRKK